MSDRRSLRLPITLGVLMIVTVVVLTVGWVLLASWGGIASKSNAALYWVLLAVGTVFLVFVLVGVIMYLTLSIKAINLNRRQANFVDSVTHELKSPIASLKLILQTLNRRQVNADERDEFYRFMLEDIERLDGLINHLLDAARLDKPSTADETAEAELTPILDKCADSIRARYRLDPERIRMDPLSCVVQGSEFNLDLIFRNLLDNAVKYAGDDPQVEVEMQPLKKDWILVRISDNGHGIPPKLRRKIFGRFVRLGLELERKKPGTGLGLYIVRTAVRQLGGVIRVRDRRSGTGTVFEVQLRGRTLAETADTAPESAPSQEAVVRSGS